MKALNEIFAIKVTADKLTANLLLRDNVKEDLEDIEISKEKIVAFLQQQKITFGIRYDSIEKIVETFPNVDFPIIIAEGIDKKDGIAGEITYHFDTTTDVDR